MVGHGRIRKTLFVSSSQPALTWETRDGMAGLPTTTAQQIQSFGCRWVQGKPEGNHDLMMAGPPRFQFLPLDMQAPGSRLSWTALSRSHAPATWFPQPPEAKQRWVSRSGRHDPSRRGRAQVRILRQARAVILGRSPKLSDVQGCLGFQGPELHFPGQPTLPRPRSRSYPAGPGLRGPVSHPLPVPGAWLPQRSIR